VHAHLGPFPQYDSTRERLSAYLDSTGIERALISNRAASGPAGGGSDMDETEANQACLDACAADPRLTPLYWARPGRAESLILAFRGALRAAPFAGAVFSPALNGFAADARVVDPYLQALAEVRQPALFHVGEDETSSPERIVQLARRHAALPIVIYGAAKSGQRIRILSLLRQARAARESQLYFDTAQCSAAEIAQAVRSLGSGQVLFGTDALCRGDAHAGHVAEVLRELREKLTPEEFLAVTAENARRLFRLDSQLS
jgi:predicted TIM-barrel fold metal-dependent hydrolase